MNIEFICYRRQKNMNYEVQRMNKQEHEKKLQNEKNVDKKCDIIGGDFIKWHIVMLVKHSLQSIRDQVIGEK